MHEEDDILLLNQLRSPNGREKGYRVLLSRYQRRIYWYVRRYLYDHEDANDVVQNTFIKIFRGIDSYQGQSRLSTWIFRIATNEALTFIGKKKKAALTVGERVGEGLDVNMLRADPYFDGDELQLRLLEAIETLPDKQRIVFTLRYYEEMRYREIAGVLDTSVGALKASYHHAVKKIERHINMTTQ